MKHVTPELRLQRLVERLSEEIATATDEEVMQVTAALRMKLQMKGTLAFAGLKGPYWPYSPEKFEGLTDAAEEAARQEANAPRRRPFTPFKE